MLYLSEEKLAHVAQRLPDGTPQRAVYGWGTGSFSVVNFLDVRQLGVSGPAKRYDVERTFGTQKQAECWSGFVFPAKDDFRRVDETSADGTVLRGAMGVAKGFVAEIRYEPVPAHRGLPPNTYRVVRILPETL